MLLAGATAAGDRDRIRAPALPAVPSPNPGTASLPRFALFGWVAPPIDFTTPERYAAPPRPGWNNLLGRIGFRTHDDWIAYLRDYTSQVKPAVLSTDHYDHFVNSERGEFVENVAGTAQVAREYGLPFWGIVLV